jgi:hypothetical protein
MAITEDKRNQLHKAASKALGREEATTLMEHLPPVGWADVATKQDLAQLEARIDLRFEVQEARFDAKLERAMRIESYRVVGGVTVVFTLFTVIQNLLGA